MIKDKKEEEILDFIKNFSKYGEEVINCFTCDNCYWFAKILETRFTPSQNSIYYDEIEGHFVCKIDKKYYDIRGEYKPTCQLYDMLWYFMNDTNRFYRLQKYCIRKEND